MAYYVRHLPHWQPEGAALFVTWRLHGSKPRNYDAPRATKLTAGQVFVLNDREWDKAATGPRWLADDRIASIVADALLHGETPMKLYLLHAWVIMSNHVHILIEPKAPLATITKTIKNFTAHKANVILNRTGRPFWAQESYDRWMRTEEEFYKTAKYIENNPLAANLCENPEDFRWSSGWTGRRPILL